MFILVKSYIQSPNFESDRYFPSKAANYAFCIFPKETV